MYKENKNYMVYQTFLSGRYNVKDTEINYIVLLCIRIQNSNRNCECTQHASIWILDVSHTYILGSPRKLVVKFWLVVACILVSCTLHFGLKYEIITNLMQLSIYLSSFSSTCFGLIRPSSGAMDVTISLHMQHMVSLV